MPAMDMQHDVDPAKVLLDQLGGFQDECALCSSQVLMAIYQPPKATSKGIYLPDQTRDEERYQGKVGLVVAVGPLAFVEDPERGVVFPVKAEVGDWVVIRGSDTWSLSVNKVPCRMMSDVAIRMIVPSPDKVY